MFILFFKVSWRKPQFQSGAFHPRKKKSWWEKGYNFYKATTCTWPPPMVTTTCTWPPPIVTTTCTWPPPIVTSISIYGDVTDEVISYWPCEHFTRSSTWRIEWTFQWNIPKFHYNFSVITVNGNDPLNRGDNAQHPVPAPGCDPTLGRLSQTKQLIICPYSYFNSAGTTNILILTKWLNFL